MVKADVLIDPKVETLSPGGTATVKVSLPPKEMKDMRWFVMLDMPLWIPH